MMALKFSGTSSQSPEGKIKDGGSYSTTVIVFVIEDSQSFSLVIVSVMLYVPSDA